MRVLIVEDSPSIRMVIQTVVEAMGHDIIEAENGADALTLFAQNDVDLVLMDVTMAVMDGFETTQRIRRIQDDWVPIIFLTGRDSSFDLEKGIEVGGDDYLVKPVDQVILRSKVLAMQRISTMRYELKRANQALIDMAVLDPLTEIMNRRGLDDLLDREWRRQRRENSMLSVIMIDVDFFKLYNDNYGHQAGDACLRQIASSLRNSLRRPGDVVARYGGEEFMVVLPATDLTGAQRVAVNLRSDLLKQAIPHDYNPAANCVTVSMGIASSGPDELALDEMIKVADDRLFEAKRTGRDRFRPGVNPQNSSHENHPASATLPTPGASAMGSG